MTGRRKGDMAAEASAGNEKEGLVSWQSLVEAPRPAREVEVEREYEVERE